MKFNILCVCAVLYFIHLDFVNSLKKNGTGVCVVTRSVKKTRLRAYIRKYKCGSKICSSRKTKPVNYTAVQNDILCCTGWTYLSDSDTCSPLCSTGCIGGTCTAPDTCQCDPPKIFDPASRTCALPKCEPPCLHGVCTANNTCTCLNGYNKINNTCQPTCDSCANGNCKAPNVCECFEGYNVSEGVCKPSCIGCDKGVCTAPGVCECNHGYLRNETSQSCYKPCPEGCGVCDIDGNCRDGVCGFVENKFICCDGYRWAIVAQKEVCKPLCRPACGPHGECVKHNECKCKPPYVVVKGICALPPKCDHPCINGKCTDLNTCTCDNLYKHRSLFYCEPECTSPCVNSTCTAPDKCDCLEGYKRKTQWECEPVCDECENGECIGPNNCKCVHGYERKNDKCIPVCRSDCVNGICSKPNECTCDSGYEIDPSDKFTCRPKCSPVCVNATCLVPNRCSCLTGYKPTANNSVCEPKCSSCSNGDCIGPNECHCHKGYVMVGKKCKPVCVTPCINGFCSEPDKCTCDYGYNLDDKGVCKPHCSVGCVNASCIAPDVCQCSEGFEMTSDNTTCKPKCLECKNGRCISGACSCNDGYIKSNGTCKPVCSQTCINGYCKSPDECECHDGYIMNSTNSICYKPCRDHCYNGHCNINAECICDDGFLLVNDTCETNVTVDCPSCEGSCSNDECRCRDGRFCNLYIEDSRTGLAGLQFSWILGACIVLLLFVGFASLIGHFMRRKKPEDMKIGYAGCNVNGSVLFTAPDTLQNRTFTCNEEDEDEDDIKKTDIEDEVEQTTERLLSSEIKIEHERL